MRALLSWRTLKGLAALAAIGALAATGLSAAGAKAPARHGHHGRHKKRPPAIGAHGVIYACVVTRTGAVRFVHAGQRCARGQRRIVIHSSPRTGPRGPAGPTGPANSEVVQGPAVTLSGNQPTGSTATSTASCENAVNGANDEAFGGGASITTSPTTSVPDIVPLQSSYPGIGVTGSAAAVPAPAGYSANAWTAVAVIQRMSLGDTATLRAYVICGP
jgi:hypothetical protein